MPTAKEDVQSLLEKLPDDVTLEDIQYHLHVLIKIRKGQSDIEQGNVVIHQDAKIRLRKYFGNE